MSHARSIARVEDVASRRRDSAVSAWVRMLECHARIVSPDFATQFLAALDNVIGVVRAAGGGTQHIVKLLAFVTDLDAYRSATKAIGEGWRTRMGKYYPAMSLVKDAGLLEPGALVEIEGQAVLP